MFGNTSIVSPFSERVINNELNSFTQVVPRQGLVKTMYKIVLYMGVLLLCPSESQKY